MKQRKCVFRLLVAVVSLVAVTAVAQTVSPSENPPNLICNPGFENSPKGFSPWGGRNWWNRKIKAADGREITETNQFSFSVDRDNPHSGKQCLKVTMTRHLGGDLQLLQKVPVKPGMPLRLSFWIRGQANTRPIALEFRRDAAPWTTFFHFSAPLTEEWKQYVFNFTLPANTSADECSLMFHLNEVNTFWLDDVAVTVLPAVEPGAVPVGNQLVNGSFEVGRDKWYATFRENGPDNASAADENNCAADIKAVITPDAPDGKRVLTTEVFPKCNMELTSAFFPLKYGHDTTIEFFLKASRPKQNKVNVSLLCGEFPNVVRESRRFTYTGPDWQRISFNVRPKPSVTGSYTLCFAASDPGVYQIDGIRVWQGTGEQAGERIASDVGWEEIDGKHPANFFTQGETPAFKIIVKAKPGSKNQLLEGNVVDAWEREIAPLKLEVPLDGQGRGEAVLTLPKCKLYGTFKASLRLAGAKDPAVEILYSVPHELSEPGTVADSFFGGHVRFSPYNLLLARKAGFRWLRLHPPNDTKWYQCETSKGHLEFPVAGSARAAAMGFKLLGNLGTVPEFYANKPANDFHNWFHAYPPKDEAAWQAYEAYVAGAVKAFAPYIKAWEIGNESDGQFLQVPKGMNREEIYMEYVRRTAKALNGRKDLTLIGGVITGGARPFMDRILEMGIGQYVDAMSFHHYSPIDAAYMAKRRDNLKFWSSFRNRDGAAMPIWHTEGFGAESATWMATTGVLFKNSALFRQQWKTSGLTVQSAICFKALGVKKHFIYALFAQPSGRIIYRNECSFMADMNGLPMPCLSAHAAAVHFLENTDPKGLRFLQSGRINVGVASFVRNGKKLDTIWSSDLLDFAAVEELKPLLAGREAFDMMGNPIASDAGLRLSAAPVYLLEK